MTMQTSWQVQEAKSRFSELIGLSLTQGPQTITRHGRAVAQIVAIGTSAIDQHGTQKTAKAAIASSDEGQIDAFTSHLLNAPSQEAALELPQRRNRTLPTALGQ